MHSTLAGMDAAHLSQFLDGIDSALRCIGPGCCGGPAAGASATPLVGPKELFEHGAFRRWAQRCLLQSADPSAGGTGAHLPVQLQCSGCLARDMVKACRQCWSCQQLAWQDGNQGREALSKQGKLACTMRTCPGPRCRSAFAFIREEPWKPAQEVVPASRRLAKPEDSTKHLCRSIHTRACGSRGQAALGNRSVLTSR